MVFRLLLFFFFFFNDTATTEIYTLSLHDALPISRAPPPPWPRGNGKRPTRCWQSRGSAPAASRRALDRKSTRLNSSHGYISYAVFCLKKKKRNDRRGRVPHRSSHERPAEPGIATA